MTEKIDWKEIHKAELINFVKDFYRTSFDWRSQAYHSKWDRWERNFRNIYDPDIKAKKEPWQATLFIPETMKNVEVISCALTKIGSGKKRPLALEPREMGDELQAELNSDLLDYYRDKGGYDVTRYKCVKEACIFGSGFMKLFWEQKYAKRRVVSPVMESQTSALLNFRIRPQPKGQKSEWQNVLVKNGVRYQHVHIRNIFIEPNAVNLERLIHRDKLTYNELRQMADQGYFDKDSVEELWNIREGNNFEQDISPLKYEQNQTDPKLPRPSYDKKHTIWEYNGPLPLKWIDLDMPEDTEKQKKAAEEVTPGIALIASANYYLSSGESQNYDGEPGFLRMDYIPNDPYGIGVGQIMEGLQEEDNEIRNQRIDNVTMIMNKMWAVIEKYVVEPKEMRSKPAGIIRLKGAEIDDIRKVLMEIPVSDVPISAFRETAEIERQIQEATAANRVTVGTSGTTRDANQTLGGMELLKQAAFDRFTVYAFLIGRTFDVQVAKKTCELVYLNIDPKSLQMILGQQPVEFLPHQYMPRWELWKRLPPEEMNICYDFVPVDVFSQENKFQKSQDLSSKMQLMASVVPGWNPVPALRRLFRYSELSSEEVADILQGLPDEPIPTPMGMGQGVPSISRPTRQNTGETPPTPAPNGNGVAPLG